MSTCELGSWGRLLKPPFQRVCQTRLLHGDLHIKVAFLFPAFLAGLLEADFGDLISLQRFGIMTEYPSLPSFILISNQRCGGLWHIPQAGTQRQRARHIVLRSSRFRGNLALPGTHSVRRARAEYVFFVCVVSMYVCVFQTSVFALVCSQESVWGTPIKYCQLALVSVSCKVHALGTLCVLY